VRRALIVLALLAVLGTGAHAQTSSPAVTTLALPLSVVTTLEREAEHGCSQSFESVHAQATVRLAIDATSAVQLTFDGTYSSNMGPSPGRYMAGDHEFSRISEAHRSTWTGRATTLPDGITITFDHVDAAEARWSGYGTLPLGPTTSQAFSAQMRCAIVRTDVLPSVPADGEQPVSTPLLSCAWVGANQPPFDRYTEEGTPFVLGRGPGVRDTIAASMWSYGYAHQVRLAP
jgi:hypothetical protein